MGTLPCALAVSAAMVGSIASASIPGRESYCFGTLGNYYHEDRFNRGLTSVSMNWDVFDHTNNAYALIHCRSQQYVLVQQTPRNDDVSAARQIILGMFENGERETFEDVAAELGEAGFIADVHDTANDACICKEVN